MLKACSHLAQALRASLLKKYAIVRRELDTLHSKRMSEYEKIGGYGIVRHVQGEGHLDGARRVCGPRSMRCRARGLGAEGSVRSRRRRGFRTPVQPVHRLKSGDTRRHV